MADKKLGNTWFMCPLNADTNEMIAKLLLQDGFSEESLGVAVQCLDKSGYLVVRNLWRVPVEYFQQFKVSKPKFRFISYDCYKKSSDGAFPKETPFMSSNWKTKKKRGKKIKKVEEKLGLLGKRK